MELDITLLLVGFATILAFFIGKIANKIRLPAVVGYIVTGVILAPLFLEIFGKNIFVSMDIVTDIALAFVAFTIGSELRREIFTKVGKGIIVIILAESFFAFIFVAGGVFLLTGDWPLSLILGAIAPASAPAGTLVVLQEFRAKGPLTTSLLAVVGLDDGLGIIIFAFAAAIARTWFKVSGDSNILSHMGLALLEILGAIVLGAILAFLLIIITRKIRSRNDILIVSVAIVLVCAGLSNYLHFSLILSNLVLGALAINLSWRAGQRSYDALQSITPPIYVLFFVIAGGHLDVTLLWAMGLIGVVYVLTRLVGKILGAYAGSRITNVPEVIRKYLWLGIVSQAGVAIGLALLVFNEFSRFGPEGSRLALIVINTAAATTLIFEIIAPITTKLAIGLADEVGKAEVKE